MNYYVTEDVSHIYYVIMLFTVWPKKQFFPPACYSNSTQHLLLQFQTISSKSPCQQCLSFRCEPNIFSNCFWPQASESYKFNAHCFSSTLGCSSIFQTSFNSYTTKVLVFKEENKLFDEMSFFGARYNHWTERKVDSFTSQVIREVFFLLKHT